MKVAKFTIKGVSPYSQSKLIGSSKKDKENAKDHEARCWRERMHYDADGMCYIPPMAVKNALAECAKFLSIQIPGKGKNTYTKHFEAGLLCQDPMPLGVHKDDVDGEWLFVPSDGKRGGGRRVEKCFPKFNKWEVEATVYILDDTITEDAFAHHLDQAGKFIGLGRFRPRNAGFYGRFEVENLRYEEV